jgi:hypothetical protein
MSQSQPPGEHSSSAGTAPSAEELKDRVDNIGSESNLGAGGGEPDPATADNPPSDIEAGDQKRKQT